MRTESGRNMKNVYYYDISFGSTHINHNNLKGIRFTVLYPPKCSVDLPSLAGLYKWKPFQSPKGYSRAVGSIKLTSSKHCLIYARYPFCRRPYENRFLTIHLQQTDITLIIRKLVVILLLLRSTHLLL